MNIHERIDERASLAKTYAEDGAFRSAARVLAELSAELVKHADWCDGLLEEMAAKPVEAAIDGWSVEGDYYVRADGMVRVNLSHVRDAKRPFAIYRKGLSDAFPVWAPHRYATAQAAMRAA